MRRLLLFGCFAALAVAQSRPPLKTKSVPLDFRKAAWGMTQAQVRATEPNPPSEVRESNGEVLMRYDSIQFAGLDSQVVYIFAQDRLVRGKYLFKGEHADLNDFIADYKMVEPVLVKWYGKPTTEKAVWNSDTYQTESLSYLERDRPTPTQILPSDSLVGLSVSEGHLKLYTQWSKARTALLHALTGEKGQIIHQISASQIPAQDSAP